MSPGIVAESDLSGNLKSEYVFFDGERIARKDYPGNAVFYYFSDHLKTASVITDSAGNIKEDEDYYPWGGELQFVNNDSNHYKFTGKELDSETGLDYMLARYYSNPMGRFLTPDWAGHPTEVPYANFGNPQSLNLYTFSKNNPTTFGDPDGHDPPGVAAPAVPLTMGGDIVGAAWTLGSVLLPGLIGGGVAYYGMDTVASNNYTKASATIESVHATNQLAMAQNNTNKTTPPPPPGPPAPGTQAGSQPKDVYIDPSKYPASARHAADAQKSGQPEVLTVDRSGADARRAAATAGHGTQTGTDRDEYPPAVTAEGGKGASVRNIPSSDNRGAGASLGQQIKDVPNGGKVKVNIGPKPEQQ
jgi:RHS repeat-associated protein